MMSDQNVSRREFIQATTTGAAAGTALTLLSSPPLARAAGANERIRIGLIGPGRRGFGAHVKTLVKLRKLGANIDLVAVNDVYTVHRDRAVEYIKSETGIAPATFVDYRDMLQAKDLDAVCIATPDHWHARQTLDALRAGKHVYCEKPMTHTIDEAHEVVELWKSSGLVMQVGVQSTSLPVWDRAREMIEAGQLGKVVQFQTESSRNSRFGMSRHNEITKEMTPQTVDWKRFLGVEEGLVSDRPFDRALFGQWRCYWPFGYGMFSDLFVHRVTGMLKATGLRYPGRVVGAGGIFLEYDDREVTDVATVVADFHEGVQGLVTSTMVSEERKLEHVIRGHHGLLAFHQNCSGTNGKGTFEFVPERSPVTLNRQAKPETFEVATKHDVEMMHFSNWLEAIQARQPALVNNDPQLGAAAVMVVNLAVRSYREGKVFQVDRSGQLHEGDSSWAEGWERMSKAKAKPRQVPGWTAGDAGSLLYPPEYQKLAGPWLNGEPPESRSERPPRP